MSDADRRTWARVAPYTMTSQARVLALCDAVRYIDDNQIAGAIVECGVWRGGSMMAATLTLRSVRELYLFDTFAGMPPPSEHDARYDGTPADDLLRVDEQTVARASLDDVMANVLGTGYTGNVQFIPGKVEDTIPTQAPDRIALLRLDTDWYESTRHELEHLYPRLVPNGVLIIDDYGHWDGARRAVDEYVATLPLRPLLHRIDYTGRLAIKPH